MTRFEWEILRLLELYPKVEIQVMSEPFTFGPRIRLRADRGVLTDIKYLSLAAARG